MAVQLTMVAYPVYADKNHENWVRVSDLIEVLQMSDDELSRIIKEVCRQPDVRWMDGSFFVTSGIYPHSYQFRGSYVPAELAAKIMTRVSIARP